MQTGLRQATARQTKLFLGKIDTIISLNTEQVLHYNSTFLLCLNYQIFTLPLKRQTSCFY